MKFEKKNSDEKKGAKCFRKHQKRVMCQPFCTVLQLDEEATVTTDASEKAIGGVLSHEGRPVIYVSRKLSQAEQNFSNIEQ